VFDGHSGAQAAQIAASRVPTVVDEHLAEAKLDVSDTDGISRVVRAACLAFDHELDVDDTSGCTAIMALITKSHIFVANIGDSRAVLSVEGEALAMSYDHKPSNTEESERVAAAGGYVLNGRVEGLLAVSRAFGDFRFKGTPDKRPEEQPVSPEPDIRVRARGEGVEFLVLACDGVWDVMSNDEVIGYVHDSIASDMESWSDICESIVDHCLELGSKDNMSMAIVNLPESPFELPAGSPSIEPDDDAPNPASMGALDDATNLDDGRGLSGVRPAAAGVVDARTLPPWSAKLADVALMAQYMPQLKEARTASAKNVIFASNDSESDKVFKLEVDVSGGERFPPNAELNEKVTLWDGVGRGDLLKLDVDAIVVPADGLLEGRGSGASSPPHAHMLFVASFFPSPVAHVVVLCCVRSLRPCSSPWRPQDP